MAADTEKIVLGGGCFWCVEAALAEVPGVLETAPGYAGGRTPDPTYKDVCGGLTGHTEVVLVEYDPEKITLEELLEFFFAIHDPTTPNRQGHDVGSQYRSTILYDSMEQEERVERFIEGIAPDYEGQIVTQVQPLETFYPAEEYHHKYFEKNPRQPYCVAVVSPKVEKVQKKLAVR